MKRREFIKKLGAFGAAGLVAGNLTDSVSSMSKNEIDIIKTLLDSKELTGLVNRKLYSKQFQPIFLSRTNIIKVGDVKDFFEYLEQSNIPHIKIGSRVSKTFIEKTKSRDNNFTSAYKNNLAERLSSGLAQTMEAMIISFMTGLHVHQSAVINKKLKINSALPKHLHKIYTFGRRDNLVGNIKKMTKRHNFNRVTLSSHLFKIICESRFFSKSESTEKKSENFIKILREHWESDVELHDNFQNTGNGIIERHYLPSNKIILTNSFYDNSDDGIVFGNIEVTESRAIAELQAKESLYIAAYYHTGVADSRAWVITRGFPKIVNPECFGTITINDV